MPAGATPLDPDESTGLMPGHIATREQLDEWEAENILEGQRWAAGAAKRRDILDDAAGPAPAHVRAHVEMGRHLPLH